MPMRWQVVSRRDKWISGLLAYWESKCDFLQGGPSNGQNTENKKGRSLIKSGSLF